jgi:riboflavin biosynthesis pyrimidine reductase
VATTSKAPSRKVTSVKNLGAEVLVVKKNKNGGVSLRYLLRELGKRGITSVMVEGGSEIVTSLLKVNLVDKMIILTAPKIMGTWLEAIGDLGVSKVKDTIKFSSFKTMRRGDDLVFEGTILKNT